MTQVDFYVLADDAPGDRCQLACRIAEKARRAGLRVLIHAPEPALASQVDNMLWTLWEQSFVPHGLLGKVDPVINPILIGDGSADNDEHQVLINLAADVPVFFSRFDRLVECVDHDETVKSSSRQRFRFYREHGYPLGTHTLS
ncbi:MAG: DNA polymerase III subunit chi [Gammaproteobacteria bacterium]|nr:DNA polymerase III subunit chi [Gammaproteobacteria bacterium]MCP5316414.1 DNA polymerase III subunit chi [Chromatiaceae bacterium]MCW5586835.1 DNA polymerase III subunit chi [Chromatiales bacterium]MCB1819080.1 DNA polymerase III subunit chi [Gammaproteobacteria bacterium]MCP5434278.1 DNA polymerase III subunit chi [Chromatiaceae bacterium]